jgi:hypothetical protein
VENDIPALSDLLRDWLHAHYPTIIVRGPDEWFTRFYYMDTNDEYVWIADIDNNVLDVTFRDKFSRKCDVVNAAIPDFFVKLEVHIKRRLNDIRESGGREYHR